MPIIKEISAIQSLSNGGYALKDHALRFLPPHSYVGACAGE